MNTKIIPAAFLIALATSAGATTISFLPHPESVIVPSRIPGEPPTILPARSEDELDIDIDGDGIPEITTLATLDASAGISFNFGTLKDGEGLVSDVFPFQEPHRAWGVTAGDVFDSVPSLLADQLFALSLTLPNYTDSYTPHGGGNMGLSPRNPVAAQWMLGTAGRTSGEAATLVAFVVDYSDYFASSGEDEVLVHTHYYGTFSAGETLPVFDLGATGVPEPSSAILVALGGALILWSRWRTRECRRFRAYARNA